MSYVLFGWAALAVWHWQWQWQWIVTTSRFYSFYWVIHYFTAIVGFIGVLQAVAAVLRMPRTRRVAAFLGMWAFATFMANVFHRLPRS
ncbi:hypothetical protein AA101099_1320 [Neoasaia chiangmaiensis NBRC 101099]|nr:hypothetical protein [Neoasaia chiangmaiensis]GBR38724.1 hypothetical protein AA101099_1320 [Neoasaia chiangmaiensis NBRC 101099]GEN15763.1 hypothetical protein NCH01_21940 [Neoasaia chiangmaiensis]